MSTNRTAERDAIQAAMQRLLGGTPTRSAGAQAVVQLAAEAEVNGPATTATASNGRRTAADDTAATHHPPRQPTRPCSPSTINLTSRFHENARPCLDQISRECF